MHDTDILKSNALFIGTIDKSPIIDALTLKVKLDIDSISGQWESFIIQVLMISYQSWFIAGSDMRVGIYACYDMSAHIGVSPWHWWAYIPKKRKMLFI